MLEHVAHTGHGISILGDGQNSAGHSPEQPVLTEVSSLNSNYSGIPLEEWCYHLETELGELQPRR